VKYGTRVIALFLRSLGSSRQCFSTRRGNQRRLDKWSRSGWKLTLKRAGIPYFRIYDLRSTYAARLSAGGVADEWVTQSLRQGDAQVFKKYSQMKLQMQREALTKINRHANEMPEFAAATVKG
jgi:integrase